MMKTFDAKIKFKDNPFYGMENMLNMFQQLPKVGTHPNKQQVYNYLTDAYKECKTDTHKELFYSLVFSLGDIANRNHNIFKQKGYKQEIDNGGNSLRKTFFYVLEWMLVYNKDTKEQYYKFLPIIGEYTNLSNTFFYQIRTDRKLGTVQEIMKLPIDIESVTDYISKVLKDPRTPDFVLILWAKFLPRPSFGRRMRKRTVLPNRVESISKKLGYQVSAGDTYKLWTDRQEATIEKETFEFNLIHSLSKKMNWEVVKYEKNTRFIGFENFKKQFLSVTEAKLFAQKQILNFDKNQFVNWLNMLPAGARYNVQRRLLNKKGNEFVSSKNWITSNGEDLADWYLAWQENKIKAQAKLLSLTEEDKSKLTKTELKQIQKEAKVNVAGETIVTVLSKLIQGNLSEKDADLVSQSVMNLIKLEVPVFIFGDVSSSMQGNGVTIDGVHFKAFDLMVIAVTAFALKNPEKDLQTILGIFSNSTQILADFDYMKSTNKSGVNQWMYRKELTHIKNKPLVDKTKSFMENYKNMREILLGFDFGSTSIDSVSIALKNWTDTDAELKNIRIETVAKYPIHLYISDGDFNNLGSPAQSLLKHRQNMKQWFGWDGLTVIWDVKAIKSQDGQKFRGIPNTLYFGCDNIGILNQIFKNIHDLDLIDDFEVLQALYRSNRYEPVRELVIKKGVKSNQEVTI